MAMKPPRLTGRALATVRAAAETAGGEVPIREIMKRGMGLSELGKIPESLRGELRVDARPIQARVEHRRHDAGLGPPPSRGWPVTSRTFTDAFSSGRATPVEVATR